MIPCPSYFLYLVIGNSPERIQYAVQRNAIQSFTLLPIRGHPYSVDLVVVFVKARKRKELMDKQVSHKLDVEVAFIPEGEIV